MLGGEWHYDESSSTLQISILQLQNGGFSFSVDVEVGVYTSDDPVPSVHRLDLTGKSGRLSIPLAVKPEKVVVDPRTVLLAQWFLTEKAK